jgi:hypothetical protein
MVEKFLHLTWPKGESYDDFYLRFYNCRRALSNANINVDEIIVKSNLMKIMKEKFPEYYPAYNKDKLIDVNGLLDAFKNLYQQFLEDGKMNKKEARVPDGEIDGLSQSQINAILNKYGKKEIDSSKDERKRSERKSDNWKCGVCGQTNPKHPKGKCPKWKPREEFMKSKETHHTTKDDSKKEKDDDYEPAFTFTKIEKKGNIYHSVNFDEEEFFNSYYEQKKKSFMSSKSKTKCQNLEDGISEKSEIKINGNREPPKLFHSTIMNNNSNTNDIIEENLESIDKRKMSFGAYPVFHSNNNEMMDIERDIKYSGQLIVDSGCVVHVCAEKHYVEDLREDHECVKIRCASGAVLVSKGIGYIMGLPFYYVPGLTANLLSVSLLLDSGMRVVFEDEVKVEDAQTNEIIMKAYRKENLFMVDIDNKNDRNEKKKNGYGLLKQWHQKLGHMSIDNIIKMSKEVPNMPKFIESDKEGLEPCEICSKIKIKRAPFDKESHITATRAFQEVSIDYMGPVNDFMFFHMVDVYSKYKFGKLVKDRSQSAELFIWIINIVKGFMNRYEHLKGIVYVRCDLEFGNNEKIKSIALENGITLKPTAADSSFQNGIVERFNQTVLNMAKCMLEEAERPMSELPLAHDAAIYVLNRIITKSGGENFIPFVKLTKCEPNIKNIKRWGCLCYYRVPETQRAKADPRGNAGILIGYTINDGTYLVKDLETRAIRSTRDIKIIENANATSMSKERAIKYYDIEDIEEPVSTRTRGALKDKELTHVLLDVFHVPTTIVPSISNQPVPKSYDEAIDGPNSEEWKVAISNEYMSLVKNKCLSVADLPENKRLLGTKLVLKNKTSADGALTIRKARLTMKGYSQVYGEDYDETYAPVAHMITIRLFFNLVAVMKMYVIHVDFVTAFLNSQLSEEIYISVPPGFNERQDLLYVPDGKVLRLNKAIYGLKQSNHLWSHFLSKAITEGLGFEQLKTDVSLYIKRVDGKLLMIIVYVDDCGIAATSQEEAIELYEKLKTIYACNNLGEMKWMLGIEFIRDYDSKLVKISQSKYIIDMMDKFKEYVTTKKYTMPADPKELPTDAMKPSTDEELELMKNVPYRPLLGSLLWLMVVSRPDISYIIIQLAKYQSDPGILHWKMLLRVFHYVISTKDMYLTLGGIDVSEIKLIVYSDANYSKVDNCKSVSGYVTTIGGVGSLSWSSKLQPVTALSTTEAEYMALSSACQEALYLRSLLSEIGLVMNDPTVIYCDSTSAINLTKHDIEHGRSKHINTRFHFIRDQIMCNLIKVVKIPTIENRADMVSKQQVLNLFVNQRKINLGI